MYRPAAEWLCNSRRSKGAGTSAPTSTSETANMWTPIVVNVLCVSRQGSGDFLTDPRGPGDTGQPFGVIPMWSAHFATIYPHISLQDRDTLELVARVKFKYHPGSPEVAPTYAHGGLPADGYEVDAVEIVSLHMDFGGGKFESLPLTKELCDWIAETVDHDTLAESAEEDREAERDEAAEYNHADNREMRLARLYADCGDD